MVCGREFPPKNAVLVMTAMAAGGGRGVDGAGGSDDAIVFSRTKGE